MSKGSSKIINWENVLKCSTDFKNRNPTKWAFIENFFEEEFYETLRNTYPIWDNTWGRKDSADKNSNYKMWHGKDTEDIAENSEDNNFSESWNEFHRYLFSEEFIGKMREFSGISINKLRHFSFSYMRKRGFQLSHVHNVGSSTVILMIYFSKNWKKGDPGGTYVATDFDESSIVYEPYNLDNSAMIFHDGPYAFHGVRPIEKDVERKAVQVYLEEYVDGKGWSGSKKEPKLVEL